MGKKASHARPGAAGRPPRQAGYIHVSARDALYAEIRGTYQFQPGSPLRDISCLTCGMPAGGQPVQLSFLSRQDPCDMSSGHAPAVMFLRHVACPNLDNATIRDAIEMNLRPCYHMPAVTPHGSREPG